MSLRRVLRVAAITLVAACVAVVVAGATGRLAFVPVTDASHAHGSHVLAIVQPVSKQHVHVGERIVLRASPSAPPELHQISEVVDSTTARVRLDGHTKASPVVDLPNATSE